MKMKKRNFASNVILTDTKDNNDDEKRALKKIANLSEKSLLIGLYYIKY